MSSLERAVFHLKTSLKLAAVGVLLTGFAVAGRDLDAPSPLINDTLPAKLGFDAIPLGLDARKVPDGNALSEARVQLGRKLFFDPILSADNTVACATCHQPAHGFSSGEAKPRGIRGQRTARKAPTLFNRAFGVSFFWDGREATLESQALRPIEHPAELGSKVADVVKRLQDHKDYKGRFEEAYEGGVTADNLGKALASFERVLLRGDSAVDRFRRKGDFAALTPEERHGLWLYESKAHCWRCHTGANFTDEQVHNTGVSWGQEPVDLGRFAVTKRAEDRGKFKTPTLRGVALTGPYMHDGSLKSLEDVVEFYNRGGGANPHRDPILEPLGLTKDDLRDLVAFLKAL
ncbi:MAG: cytochrome-c peroxidase [Gemmataceae bacterium]